MEAKTFSWLSIYVILYAGHVMIHQYPQSPGRTGAKPGFLGRGFICIKVGVHFADFI